MNELAKRIPRLGKLKVFEWQIFAFLIIALGITLSAGFSVRSYTSDDVSTQTAMQTWSRGEPRHVAQSTDTWVLKMPIYAVNNLLLQNSRSKLLIENLVCNLILLVGCIYFIRRLIIRGAFKDRVNPLLAYLPVLWFISPVVSQAIPGYSAARTLTLMNPDLRNAELGISLFLIALLFERLPTLTTTKLGLKHWAGLGLLSTALGLFVYNDPYFLYVLIVPTTVFSIYYWLRLHRDIRGLMLASLVTVGAFASYLFFNLVGYWLGIETIDNVSRQFAPLTQLAPNLVNMARGLLHIFGADFWNYPLSVRSLSGLAAAALLALVGWANLATLRPSVWRKYPERLLIILIVALNLGIYALTTLNNAANERYMIFAVLAAVMLLAMWAVSLRKLWLKVLVCFTLTISVLGNLSLNSAALIENRHNNPNKLNYTIIDQIKKSRLSKGYAAYWDANINTYLSNHEVHFLPVICDGYSLKKMEWLINKPEFNLPAERTFYLYNSTETSPRVDACTPQLLSEHAGILPIEQIRINQDYTVFIYSGDIGQSFEFDPSFE